VEKAKRRKNMGVTAALITRPSEIPKDTNYLAGSIMSDLKPLSITSSIPCLLELLLCRRIMMRKM
jgi:hypothetical protein